MNDMQAGLALQHLPKTKDGAPIYPTMELFISSKLMPYDARCATDVGDGVVSVRVASVHEWPKGSPQVCIQATWHGGEPIDPKMFYSSKAAVLMANKVASPADLNQKATVIFNEWHKKTPLDGEKWVVTEGNEFIFIWRWMQIRCKVTLNHEMVVNGDPEQLADSIATMMLQIHEHSKAAQQTQQDKPVPEAAEILKSFDAADWAKNFLKCIKANPKIPTDEGTMIGWFANALMRGHDEVVNRAKDVGGYEVDGGKLIFVKRNPLED